MRCEIVDIRFCKQVGKYAGNNTLFTRRVDYGKVESLPLFEPRVRKNVRFIFDKSQASGSYVINYIRMSSLEEIISPVLYVKNDHIIFLCSRDTMLLTEAKSFL